MIAATTYKLGTALNNMQTLAELGLPRPSEPQFQEYRTQEIGLLNQPIELGFPNAEWLFKNLSDAQFQILYGYTGDNAYVNIYVATLVNFGVTWVYRVFAGIMWRPTASATPSRRRSNVKIKFTGLVVQ